MMKVLKVGTQTSGFEGHAGRIGRVGGSVPRGGAPSRELTPEEQLRRSENSRRRRLRGRRRVVEAATAPSSLNAFVDSADVPKDVREKYYTIVGEGLHDSAETFFSNVGEYDSSISTGLKTELSSVKIVSLGNNMIGVKGVIKRASDGGTVGIYRIVIENNSAGAGEGRMHIVSMRFGDNTVSASNQDTFIRGFMENAFSYGFRNDLNNAQSSVTNYDSDLNGEAFTALEAMSRATARQSLRNRTLPEYTIPNEEMVRSYRSAIESSRHYRTTESTGDTNVDRILGLHTTPVESTPSTEPSQSANAVYGDADPNNTDNIWLHDKITDSNTARIYDQYGIVFRNKGKAVEAGTFVREAYEFTDPDTGMHTDDINVRLDLKGQFEVKGIVRSRDNVKVGNFTRTLKTAYPNGEVEVHHDFFELSSAYQGSGFGSAFYRHSEEAYKKAGVDEITIFANIDVGGYAWARMGFDFDDSSELRSYQQKLLHRLDYGTYSSGDRDAHTRIISNMKHAWEVAAYVNPNGEKWGKDLLLGNSWYAHKYLTDTDPGYQAGKAYYDAKDKAKHAKKS